MTKADEYTKKLYKKERQAIGHFIAIPDKMYEHEAFKTLPASAKVVLVEFIHRWDLERNGQVVAGIISLAKSCNMTPKTAHSAIRVLQARGFIIKKKAGLFTMKAASEYLVTFRGHIENGTVKLKDLWKYWKEGLDFTDEQARKKALESYTTSIGRTH